jgi:4-hydroxy-tetrahydrodipicolinate synthase
MIENMNSPFGSLITAMVTPFQTDTSLDLKATEAVINHLIVTKSDSIVVNGTTGESPTLEESEQKELFVFAKDKAKGKAKIIAGVGSNSTAKTIKYSHVAEQAGVDGLLVVVPYYNKPTQAGLIRHFQEIAKSTSLPIIVYNIPGRTGINMTVETTLELIDTCKNIIALKDSTGGVEQAADIAAKAGNKKFWIYSGDDPLTLPYLSIGGAGVISVASHLVGIKIKAMIDSYFKGDYDQARKIHYECLPFFKGIFAAPNPTCIKYALSKAGLCQETLRLPLVPLASAEKTKLEAIMKTTPIDTPKTAMVV